MVPTKACIRAGALLAILAAGAAHATDKPTTKQLNQAQIKAVQTAKAQAAAAAKAGAAATAGGGGGGSASTSGDKIDGSWGFSYARNPSVVPQAVIGQDVAITSHAYEVGPLFSMATQGAEYLPAGMANLSAMLTMASRNDGTPAGRSAQADLLAVICYKAPGLATIRYGDGACGQIRRVVEEGTVVPGDGE